MVGEQFTDKTIVCGDCGRPFVHSAEEQEFFRQRGFMNEPKRCKECRHRRKSERGYGSRGSSPGYAPARRSGPPPAPKVQPVAVPVAPSEDIEAGEAVVAVCGRCGRETQLAHRPSPLRPVFCRECYEKWRAESGGGEAL